MIHLTLFTGIQYIKFTAVGERAVHITITKKICRNYDLVAVMLQYCNRYVTDTCRHFTYMSVW